MTDAMLYTIEGRIDDYRLGIASMEYFTLSEGQAVSSQLVIDEATWTPYCLDPDKRHMVFIDVPADVDLSQAAFVYLTQFEHGTRLLAVPYESLEALSEQIAVPEKIIFIFSLPRSGTTLASHIFNEIDNVWSLSEPDIFYWLNPFIEDETLSYLLKHAVHLMFRPVQNPQANVFVIKPRSQALFIAEKYYELFPDAKYVYLYRTGLGFANSFYRLLQRLGRVEALPRDEAINLWMNLVFQANGDYLENLIAHNQDNVGVAEFFAAMFCMQTEQYFRTFEQGVPFYAQHYDNLDSHREAELTKLLQHCDLPISALPQAMRAFEVDSQAGTSIARDIEVASFTEEEKEEFFNTLARHPRFNISDIRLPDKYHPTQES